MGDDSFADFLCDDDNYWAYHCATGDDPFCKYDFRQEKDINYSPSSSYLKEKALEAEEKLLLDQLKKKYPINP